MNGISNYGYGAYNSPYASSFKKENAANAKESTKADAAKKSEAAESQVAKGTKESIKNAAVANLLGKGTGRVVQTQSEKYGAVVGEPKLSEKAEEYYNSLKKKYGNMDFVLVSKDKINAAKAQAGSFGNPNKTVVLIDEEKLEKMATDESYRKKYEGIISMSQSKIAEMAKSFAGNPNIKSFGVKVDDKGNTSFFATVSDTSKGQKDRIEKHRAEKKAEDKAHQKKMAEKFAEKRKEAAAERKKETVERLEKRRSDAPDKADRPDRPDRPGKPETLTADSVDELIEKVQARFYTASSDDVKTEAERSVGGSVDFTA